jgi:ABC-2 type transport system permease protein
MLNGVHMRNEWRLLARYPLLWIAVAGSIGFSLLIANGSPAESGSGAVGALLRLNLFLPVFILPFIVGALGPIFYLREVDHCMAEMLGSYPLSLRQYLTMRFGNFAALLATICLLVQLVFLTFLATQYPELWPNLFAQSALWFLILHLLSCLLWASAMAWLACQKANAGYLYLAAGFGWLVYLGVATATGTPLIAGSIMAWQPLKQAMLVLDPYAATAMTSPMPEAGPLQWRWLNIGIGRLFWLGVCLMLLRNIGNLPAHAMRQTDRSDAAFDKKHISGRGKLGAGHIAIHLRYFVSDRIFSLLVLGWIALLLPEAYGGMSYAEPHSRILPDSRDALNRVAWDVLPLAGALLLLYAADRICRMYQATQMHELYGATSHRFAKLIAVQHASLWLIALLFVTTAGVSVVCAQLLTQSPVQPAEYVLQLGVSFPRLALFASLFVAIHGLLRPRFIANLICFLVLVFGFSSLAPALGLYHPLWKPLNTPLMEPDHFWGFASSLGGHLPFMLFGAAVSLAALLTAVALGNRNLPSAQVRLKSFLRHPANALAAACIGVAIWQGAAIDRILRKEGALITPNERAGQRADYERNYAHWSRIAQPDVEAIRSKVDFYPHEHRVTLHSVMRLINRNEQPITHLLVGKGPLDDGGKVSLHFGSVMRRDVRLGQTVFQLTRPLAPGEALDLKFDLELAQSGLVPASFPFVIRPEFSSLPIYALLPVIGFRRDRTLRDTATRKEQGLPDLKLLPPSRLYAAAPGSLARDKVLLNTIVSTDQRQHAVGQGSMIRRWILGDRSYFQFRTDTPIRNAPALFSVPLKPQSWSAGNYSVNSYSPKPLRGNDANILATRDTLIWLDRDVAAYPGKSLHLLAIPELGLSGYALPQIVQISHRLGFRGKPENGAGFNQVYRRAVHETAHQWFGHLLGHGILEERAFLIESLAKYAELVMIERRYGRVAMLALVTFERDRYRQARLDPGQATAFLIDAEESEDMYSRATLAFACLRSKVGDGPILAALKSVAEDSRRNDRAATSLGFINTLKAASSPQHADTINQLFLSAKPIQSAEQELGCD